MRAPLAFIPRQASPAASAGQTSPNADPLAEANRLASEYLVRRARHFGEAVKSDVVREKHIGTLVDRHGREHQKHLLEHAHENPNGSRYQQVRVTVGLRGERTVTWPARPEDALPGHSRVYDDAQAAEVVAAMHTRCMKPSIAIRELHAHHLRVAVLSPVGGVVWLCVESIGPTSDSIAAARHAHLVAEGTQIKIHRDDERKGWQWYAICAAQDEIGFEADDGLAPAESRSVARDIAVAWVQSKGGAVADIGKRGPKTAVPEVVYAPVTDPEARFAAIVRPVVDQRPRLRAKKVVPEPTRHTHAVHPAGALAPHHTTERTPDVERALTPIDDVVGRYGVAIDTSTWTPVPQPGDAYAIEVHEMMTGTMIGELALLFGMDRVTAEEQRLLNHKRGPIGVEDLEPRADGTLVLSSRVHANEHVHEHHAGAVALRVVVERGLRSKTLRVVPQEPDGATDAVLGA